MLAATKKCGRYSDFRKFAMPSVQLVAKA